MKGYNRTVTGTLATVTGTPVAELGQRAKEASRAVSALTTSEKDAALHAAADLLESRSAQVLEANASDVRSAEEAGTGSTVIDRLRLTEGRIRSMAEGLRNVAALADPVGEVVAGWVRPNGLEIRQVRVPLGVVAIIYENRPNVTSDAAALCLKSGNVAFLRGSSGAIHSNLAIAGVLQEAYVKVGVPRHAVIVVDDVGRESAREFMRLDGIIDCLIPRGGPSLIASIKEHATVPYVIDGDGNCHVYVDASADLDMAAAIVVNAKTQRPSVCNAAESLLVHRSVAPAFLPQVAAMLDGVELRGDPASIAILGAERMTPASEEDYGREFLDLVLSVAVVDDVGAAIDHVRRFGSGHTEAIVTRDLESARRFQKEVDAAAVVVNASTRFTDGEEFGFGAEIGISTQKLHARGPMGLRELTTTKYLVVGSGQIRD
jgi:glutamate-5-semialdehyde dehydrogenase